MQIRPKLGQIFKNTKTLNRAKQNICRQTTSENGRIIAIWPQKGLIPNPGPLLTDNRISFVSRGFWANLFFFLESFIIEAYLFATAGMQSKNTTFC